jgi:DNA-binding beta-propeller fold protein YncE
VERELIVGLHASGLAASADGRFVAVANANSDSVTVIDTTADEIVETISTSAAVCPSVPAPGLDTGYRSSRAVWTHRWQT